MSPTFPSILELLSASNTFWNGFSPLLLLPRLIRTTDSASLRAPGAASGRIFHSLRHDTHGDSQRNVTPRWAKVSQTTSAPSTFNVFIPTLLPCLRVCKWSPEASFGGFYARTKNQGLFIFLGHDSAGRSPKEEVICRENWPTLTRKVRAGQSVLSPPTWAASTAPTALTETLAERILLEMERLLCGLQFLPFTLWFARWVWLETY